MDKVIWKSTVVRAMRLVFYFLIIKKKTVFILYIQFLFWESNLYVNKVIWKSTVEWSYFLDNVLVRVKVVFLSACSLILFLLKHKVVEAFLNKKKKVKFK